MADYLGAALVGVRSFRQQDRVGRRRRAALVGLVSRCAAGYALVQSFVAKFKDEFIAKGAADEVLRPSGGVEAASELKIPVNAQA